MLRKIGGIYFLRLGPFRLSFCRVVPAGVNRGRPKSTQLSLI